MKTILEGHPRLTRQRRVENYDDEGILRETVTPSVYFYEFPFDVGGVLLTLQSSAPTQ